MKVSKDRARERIRKVAKLKSGIYSTYERRQILSHTDGGEAFLIAWETSTWIARAG